MWFVLVGLLVVLAAVLLARAVILDGHGMTRPPRSHAAELDPWHRARRGEQDPR